MTKSLVLTGLLVANTLLSSHAIAGPDCTCRYQGKKIPEGQSTCIKTASGYKMAQCSRVLNNTSWKFTKKQCPVG